MTVVVNSQQGSFSTSTAATTQAITPTGIVAGRSLILLIANAGGSATGAVTNVTDTGGNVWTRPDPPAGGVSGGTFSRITVAYVHNCIAPGTITATMGSIGNRKLLLLEVTGLQNVAADAAAEDFAAASSAINIAPSVTTTGAAWAVALVGRGGTTSDPTGVTAGWTLSNTGVPDNTTPILRAAWQEFAVAGATGTCSFTFGTAFKAGLGTIAFKVTASGTVFTKSISGAASFSGIRPVVAMSRRQPGVLSFAGAEVAHPTARRVTGSFTPTGALSRQLSLARSLAGALSFTGSTSTATAYARSLVGAVFTPTGVNTRVKAVSKSVTGALTFSGAIVRFPMKSFTAIFTPTGSETAMQALQRTLTAAAFSSQGVISRVTNRKFTGAASWVGAFAATSRGALTATFHPTGTASHGLPARTLTAAANFTGSVVRFTSRQLFSSLIASSVMNTQYLPPIPPGSPGGGGYGALMSNEHFARYQVTGAWGRVRRVKV